MKVSKLDDGIIGDVNNNYQVDESRTYQSTRFQLKSSPNIAFLELEEISEKNQYDDVYERTMGLTFKMVLLFGHRTKRPGHCAHSIIKFTTIAKKCLSGYSVEQMKQSTYTKTNLPSWLILVCGGCRSFATLTRTSELISRSRSAGMVEGV